MTEPTVETVAYQVSCLPSSHPDAQHFSLRVERRSTDPDRWAVTEGFVCYDANGRQEYESTVTNRTDTFRRQFRHTLTDAMELARKIAPTMTVNGWTVQALLDHHEPR